MRIFDCSTAASIQACPTELKKFTSPLRNLACIADRLVHEWYLRCVRNTFVKRYSHTFTIAPLSTPRATAHYNEVSASTPYRPCDKGDDSLRLDAPVATIRWQV